MAGVTIDVPVPASRDRRLDELAEILAGGLLRLGTKKSGFTPARDLSLSRKEGSVSPTCRANGKDSEVT